jgi:aspartyl-tRNA(Asn)/glutamyl-tRNA(Gln) amidotransferase subunit C
MTGMPSISRDEAAHLARLARLDLDATELEHLAGQLDVILAAVAQVCEVAAADVPPTSHALPLTNVTRPDVVRPSLGQDAALAGAPAAEDGRFRVPRILGEEQ